MMNPKILIVIALVGIMGLAVFNLVISHNTAEASKAETPTVTATTNTSIGLQPKTTMDKATSQINQANVDTNAKMAQADNVDGGK